MQFFWEVISQIETMHVAIFLINYGTYLNILFIVKVKILVLK